MGEPRRSAGRPHCVVTVRVPADGDAVSSALEAMAASDADLTVHDVRVDDGAAVEFDARELTEKQRETIVRAVEIGYYATPRRGSLDDLCAEFDLVDPLKIAGQDFYVAGGESPGEGLPGPSGLMDRVETDRDLIFEELPHALADAGAEYFRMDREPKEKHAEEARERLFETVGGLRGAAKLAYRYRGVLR
ncbi:MAG: helix-turn-helix domain-containing protein [Halorubrum sp.]